MNSFDQDPPTASPLPSAPPYRDRGTAILLMGLFVAFLGLCCFGMLAMMGIGIAASALGSPAGQAPLRSLIPAFSVYLIFAAFFLTTGIGSAMVKRWARALLAVISWMWLAFGVVAFVMMVVLLPKLGAVFRSATPPGAAAPPAGLMVGCMLAMVIVIYVALPLALALFFSGKNVKGTFEARDRPRWTDRLPAPLLGLLLIFAFSSACLLVLPLYGVIPAFGLLLTGTSAWVFGCVLAAATGAGAWWVWQRSILGWWTGVALWILGAASTARTFSGDFDWDAYYTHAGLTAQQIELTRGLSPAELFSNPLILGLMVVMWIAVGAVLFWTKKFFVDPAAPE